MLWSVRWDLYRVSWWIVRCIFLNQMDLVAAGIEAAKGIWQIVLGYPLLWLLSERNGERMVSIVAVYTNIGVFIEGI